MTISSETRKAGPFTGNDSTTVFPFTFKVFEETDVVVIHTDTSLGVETTLTKDVDYTVSLNADQNASPGGTVTLGDALATGYTLTLTSDVPMLQAVDLTNQGGFYPNVINNALDRLTVFAQQLNDAAERAVKVPISSATDPDALIASVIAAAASAAASAATATSAAAAAEAAVPSGLLGFTPVNIAGDTMTGGLEVPSLVVNGGATITSITTAAKNLLDDTTVAAMLTTLGAQETLVSGTNIKTVNGGSLLGSGEALPVPGTSGNLLTSNGSAWVSQAAPSTSPWVLISTTNATSVAAIDFTWDESLYGSVVLLLDGVGPASDNQNLHMRFGYSNGSTIDATGGAYTSFITSKASTNTPEEITHNALTLAVLADHFAGKVGNLTAEVMNAVIEVTAAGSGTSSGVGATARGSFINLSGTPVSFITRVLHSTGTPRAYDTVRLLWESGNFAAKGTIKLYGLKRS